MLRLRNELQNLHLELSSQVLDSYNQAIVSVLRIAVALAALSILGSLGADWTSRESGSTILCLQIVRYI
jgi:hypothetical protein